jgi:urate oxidase
LNLSGKSHHISASVINGLNCSYSTKPADYQKTYEEVKDVLVTTFFGPPHEGVYSPSVQKTLYEMAQAVLARYYCRFLVLFFHSSQSL